MTHGTQARSNANIVISDLRERPEFFDSVAERIWQQWWKDRGCPLAYIADRLQETMNDAPIPFALVAHDGSVFAGTASLIETDLAERPQFSPWVAAVWVEPKLRGDGIGAALVERAVQACFDLGPRRVYLCASQERSSFYTQRGWTLLEHNVGARLLNVFARGAAGNVR